MPHPDPRIPRDGATLSEVEAIRIAKATALNAGVRLSDFDPPLAHYEYVVGDHTWLVSYSGKILRPGNDFLVAIDDKTREATFEPGE